jgi:hypothetical protein
MQNPNTLKRWVVVVGAIAMSLVAWPGVVRAVNGIGMSNCTIENHRYFASDKMGLQSYCQSLVLGHSK